MIPSEKSERAANAEQRIGITVNVEGATTVTVAFGRSSKEDTALLR